MDTLSIFLVKAQTLVAHFLEVKRHPSNRTALGNCEGCLKSDLILYQKQQFKFHKVPWFSK